jgi:two-component system sensor histidine kinase KdpD
LLATFCSQTALALHRVLLAQDAQAAELRARAEELRSALLSSVSHDLRTPLAAITGAATTLRDDPALATATRAELTASICDEAERLERLLSNLLDMTRLESGELTLKREWLPIEEPIGGALVRLEKKLGLRTVTTTIAGEVPLLHGDPVLMEQLLYNLLENATKYTPPDSPIEIRARAEEDRLIVEIADRGPGLRPGDEERVFERFYRGNAREGAGVGLGLPICRAIATVHGGTLTAANREGGGAVFTLCVPRGESPPPGPPSEPPT